MMPPEALTLLISSAMAVAAALVGCFAVMRKMALAADAISHLALPGIGLALILHVQPLAGALVMLFLGILLIWGLERTAKLSTETVIGVVFTTALAVGSLMMTGEELIDALLGEPGVLTGWESAFALMAALGVVAFVLRQKDRLLVSLVSPEIAHAAGIRVALLDLEYLFALSVTVALGLRYLGVLLMGALIIIPAAAAKRVAHDLRTMFAVAAAISVASTSLGTWAGLGLHLPPGPPIVLLAGGFFFLSLLWRDATKRGPRLRPGSARARTWRTRRA